MYSRIEKSKSVRMSIEYSEQKLELGQAESLLAENFVKEHERLTKEEKIQWLEWRTCLNERAKADTLHFSLNFSPADQLSNEQMKTIARKYMESMGLGEDPYLGYRHFDAGHPHLHIVAPKIKADGDIIHLEKRDFFRSLKITGELEKEFSLVPRLTKESLPDERIQRQLPYAQRIKYGETPMMPAMSKVFDAVLDVYKYTSLEEFNAILRLYNMKADRGHENSQLYQKKGLLYRVIDEQGRNQGRPLKASLFNVKPVLQKLEQKFALNLSLRQGHEQRVTVSIDWTLYKERQSLETFKDEMRKERISVVTRQDKKGELKAIYYVDHQTKCVFDGSALGGRYTVQAIAERCLQGEALRQMLSLRQEQELVQRQRLRLGL